MGFNTLSNKGGLTESFIYLKFKSQYNLIVVTVKILALQYYTQLFPTHFSTSVSYTHLDVYKRQVCGCVFNNI